MFKWTTNKTWTKLAAVPVVYEHLEYVGVLPGRLGEPALLNGELKELQLVLELRELIEARRVGDREVDEYRLIEVDLRACQLKRVALGHDLAQIVLILEEPDSIRS